MLIYIKKNSPNFVTLIKWLLYFMSDRDKLVGARATCLKTIKSERNEQSKATKRERWSPQQIRIS